MMSLQIIEPIAVEPTSATRMMVPPPPAIPMVERVVPEPKKGFGPMGPSVYSIGEPTDEEQLSVELINRARANPALEGQRLATATDPEVQSGYQYFGVDLALMQTEMAAFNSAPPVSINEKMTSAARRHSQDMFNNQFQQHNGSDGSNPGSRLSDAGYNWNRYGENIYAYAQGVWHGHAALMVDWGSGTGGMQNGRGHRVNMLNSNYREIGVGMVLGVNDTVGPVVLTQDLGSRAGINPMITGVIYYDFNNNQFYDLGEGLGGVRLSVAGGSYYALTSRSGGYSLPVTQDGTYSVTISVPGTPDVVRNVTVSGGANAKLDYCPIYAPPVLSGLATAYINWDNPYTFTAVGGATGYDWRSQRHTSWSTPEGAENGLAPVTVVSSPGYKLVSTTVKRSGKASFHLAHPSPANQILTLNSPIRLGPTNELVFYSRLGWASESQVARAQISIDDGLTWLDVWSKQGTDGAGESAFQKRTISLAAHAGRIIRLRFAYTFDQGSFYPQTNDTAGFFLDDVIIARAGLLSDEVITAVESGTQFNYRPSTEGDFLLQVRAKAAGRAFQWGPDFAVTAQAGGNPPPLVKLTQIKRLPGGTLDLRWRLESGNATSYQVRSASNLLGSWINEAATVETTSTPGEFRALITPSDAMRFYRIAVP